MKRHSNVPLSRNRVNALQWVGVSGNDEIKTKTVPRKSLIKSIVSLRDFDNHFVVVRRDFL